MKTKLILKKMAYDGTQLRSLFAYLGYGLLGNSIVAWEGPCNISFEHMVDGEDLLEKAEIRGDHMLHFIIEVFDYDLVGAVPLQRLFAATVKDILETQSPVLKTKRLRRSGDDIYLGQKKLSISIATTSATSRLIHFAVNISNEGTPVETLCLKDLKVNPPLLAKLVMKTFATEVEDMISAARKVRSVP